MLSNQFDHLELEDPIEIDDAQPASSTAMRTTGAATSKTEEKVSHRVEY